jgi:hypothetical protein
MLALEWGAAIIALLFLSWNRKEDELRVIDLRDSACIRASVEFLQKVCLGDLRHPHGKAVDNKMRVKRLEHISGQQTVVDARVLVLLEFRQLILSYVNHDAEFLAGKVPADFRRRFCCRGTMQEQ